MNTNTILLATTLALLILCWRQVLDAFLVAIILVGIFFVLLPGIALVEAARMMKGKLG